MDFRKLREQVVVTLNTMGISLADIHFDKQVNPRNFPCAIVSLEGSRGELKTSSGYSKHNPRLMVYLVRDCVGRADPEMDIWKISMEFRGYFQSRYRKDVDEIVYYPSKADAGRNVMIAKFEIQD